MTTVARTAFERLRVALEQHGCRVTGTGSRLSAQCPAHDDRGPSLSLTGIQGQTLVYCHAGCGTEDVLAAVGLCMADLFDEPKGVDYRYGDGRTVHRTPDKRFWQNGNTKGSALYRLDRVKAAVAAGHTVYVVEGEKDVHALETLCATATCSAMGAGKASKADWSPLTGAKVVIVADRDEAGKRHALDVRRILRALDTSVEVRCAATGKDAADHLAADGGLGDLVPVELPEDTHEQDVVQSERFPSLDWHAAFATDFTQIDWLLGRFLERGQQVTLVGDGKVGKSLLAHEWLWRAVTGRPFLGDEVRDPIRVLYFDRENGLRDIVTRMQAFGATPDELAGRFDYRMFPKFSGGLDTAGAAAAELLAIVDDTDPDVVILDTVSRFIVGKENDSDTWLQLYGRVHAPLKALGVAGIRLDHMGKDAERGSRGSSAKSQDVDHVWEMTRTSEVSTFADGIETAVTQIRMRRTHTRTGIGTDHLDITRRGAKGPHGMWLPGRTRHVLTAGGGARPDLQVFVDRLLAANCPETSRDGIKTWSIAHGIDLPGKNAVLAQVVREFKAQKAADHAGA